MEDLVTTCGKTWHTWQIDQAKLQDRDRRFDASFERMRQDRSDIAAPAVDPVANFWQGGKVMQLKLEEVPVRNPRE